MMAGGECVEALSNWIRDQPRSLDKLPVKGREQEVDVSEILWRQSEELTFMASRAPGPPTQPQARLCLRHGGKEIILGPRPGLVTLGPGSSSGVVQTGRQAVCQPRAVGLSRDTFLLVAFGSNRPFVTFA